MDCVCVGGSDNLIRGRSWLPYIRASNKCSENSSSPKASAFNLCYRHQISERLYKEVFKQTPMPESHLKEI